MFLKSFLSSQMVGVSSFVGCMARRRFLPKRPDNSLTIRGRSGVTFTLINCSPGTGSLFIGPLLIWLAPEWIGDRQRIHGWIFALSDPIFPLEIAHGRHDERLNLLWTEHPTQRPSLSSDLVLQ